MNKKPEKSRWRKWVSRGFLSWAVFVYLFSGYRTVDVEGEILTGDAFIEVSEDSQMLGFIPADKSNVGLIFLCGSGVSAHAYAPMLRPVAEQGNAVLIIKLPYRFAPFALHKDQAIERALRVMARHPEISKWIVSGHSLGGALACRVALDPPAKFAGLVLVGTTHPKRDDLSRATFPVTKVFASLDGIAPISKVDANKHLLPANAKYVRVEGGNHSQFGNYARQVLDGSATISRTTQQAVTRSEILAMIALAK